MNKISYVQVETEDQLTKLMENKIPVIALHTGPFGENKPVFVKKFGPINSIPKSEIFLDDADRMYEEFLESDDKIILLSNTIGQSQCNYYCLDAYTVADHDLYVNEEDWNEVF